MSSRSPIGVDASRWNDVGCPVGVELDLPAVGGGVVAGFDDPVVVGTDQDQVTCKLLICSHGGRGHEGCDLHPDQQRPGRQGLGVARQAQDCRALAERLGWGLAEEYVDNDVSAYSGKRQRPAYRRMLADVAAGQRDGVVIYHPDRLTRRPVELEEFAEVLSRAKVPVRFVSGGADPGTGDGLLILRIMAAVAANESASKSRRIIRKHQELAERGMPNMSGKYRPFGYADDRVTIIPEEAAAIRSMAARYLAGDSWRSIATWANLEGIKTSSGGEFTTTSLRNMLLSARIAGLREHGGVVVAAGQWEPIITPQQRQQMLDLVQARKITGRRSPRRYLLTGMVRCSRCGGKMFAAARAQGRRYVCLSGPDHGGCGKTMIQAEPVEQLVAAGVLLRLNSPAFADAMAGRAKDDQQAAQLASRINADQVKLTELATMLAEGEMSRAEWRTARDVVDRRLTEARKRLASLTHSDALTGLDLSPEKLAEQFAGLELERQHAIIATVLDHVVILPGTPGARSVDPARVEPVWRL